MKVAEAHKITGGLSTPSKMPGKAHNISAFDCIMGSEVAEKENRVCSDCYARKGRYRFANVQNALKRRLAALDHPLWIPAMVRLIGKQEYFRWFDSGDLQSVLHLEKILAVVSLTPDTKHWLPTKEYSIIKEYLEAGNVLPQNVVVRLSGFFIDQLPKISSFYKDRGVLGSMVYKDKADIALLILHSGVYGGPAYTQDNECGNCRACWENDFEIVGYPKH